MGMISYHPKGYIYKYSIIYENFMCRNERINERMRHIYFGNEYNVMIIIKTTRHKVEYSMMQEMDNFYCNFISDLICVKSFVFKDPTGNMLLLLRAL